MFLKGRWVDAKRLLGTASSLLPGNSEGLDEGAGSCLMCTFPSFCQVCRALVVLCFDCWVEKGQQSPEFAWFDEGWKPCSERRSVVKGGGK